MESSLVRRLTCGIYEFGLLEVVGKQRWTYDGLLLALEFRVKFSRS